MLQSSFYHVAFCVIVAKMCKIFEKLLGENDYYKLQKNE